MPLGNKKTEAFDIYKTESLGFGDTDGKKSKKKGMKKKRMSGTDNIFAIGSKAK